jgi:hypothetical protein
LTASCPARRATAPTRRHRNAQPCATVGRDVSRRARLAQQAVRPRGLRKSRGTYLALPRQHAVAAHAAARDVHQLYTVARAGHEQAAVSRSDYRRRGQPALQRCGEQGYCRAYKLNNAVVHADGKERITAHIERGKRRQRGRRFTHVCARTRWRERPRPSLLDTVRRWRAAVCFPLRCRTRRCLHCRQSMQR